MQRLKTWAVAPFLLLAVACQGPDLLRHQTDVAGYELAKRCARGWFSSAQFTPLDEAAVTAALGDWHGRLVAEAHLIGAPEPTR